VALAEDEWGRYLTRVLKVVLLLILLLWNILLLGILFTSMPKNDFGRPFWSTLAFLRGEDMYALNESVVYLFKETTILHLWDLNPPHAHLLPLAVLPPRLALQVWCLLGGFCLYGSIRIVLTQLGLKLTPSQGEWLVLGLLGFTGMGTAVLTGHMSFPLMLLITLAWCDARHGRWWRAGAWLGLGMSHAADGIGGLEDLDLNVPAGQNLARGQTGWSRADDCDSHGCSPGSRTEWVVIDSGRAWATRARNARQS
jgi:hypothetical protein